MKKIKKIKDLLFYLMIHRTKPILKFFTIALIILIIALTVKFSCNNKYFKLDKEKLDPSTLKK